MATPGAALAAVRVPTLVITGEPRSIAWCPSRLTREYLTLWPHATTATLARTGHLGLITRPRAFAALVAPFIDSAHSNRNRGTTPLADVIRDIPGPAGPLEALIDKPAGTPRAAVVFAHPLPIEGGTMHTKVVFQGAKALTRIGCVVLRFNFRGVGRSAGTWDEGRGELDDYRAAVDFMAARASRARAVGGRLLVRLVHRHDRRRRPTRASAR